MTGEAERNNAGLIAPTCEPQNRAKRIAEFVALSTVILLAVAGLAAAAGLMSDYSAETVLSIHFWLWSITAVTQSAGTLYRAGQPREQRRPTCTGSGRVTIGIRLLWLCFLAVLLYGRYYGLAALLGYCLILGVARRAEDKRIRGQGNKIGLVSRHVHRAVFAVAEVLFPVYEPVHRLMVWRIRDLPLIGWLLFIPFTPLFILFALGWIIYWLLRGLFAIPFLLFGRVQDWSDRRALIRTASADGIFAWFAYAEPHQREYFLGEGGALHGLGGAVIARDWRTELGEAWRAGRLDDLDALMVKQCRLSNMREDLPVIVLLEPDGGIQPIHLNRAYRQRFRDGGDLLGALEARVRERVETMQLAASSPA